MKRLRVLATLGGVAALSGSGVSIAATGAKRGQGGPSPKQTVLAGCLEANGAQVAAASLNHGYLAAHLSDPRLLAALQACRATPGVPDSGTVAPPGASKPGA